MSFPCTRDLTCNDMQRSILSKIDAVFAKNQQAFFLVCGAPGIGKTTLGEILATTYKKRLPPQFEVQKVTVDLARPGASILNLFFERTPDTLVILVLNEYDIVMKMAMGDLPCIENKDFTSHADSKTSLNNLWDEFLLMQKNLIVIATTNEASLLSDPKYASFCRRFDRCIKV